MIQWEVRPFASHDPLDDDGELLTLVRDFSRDSTFETLFVVHPEPATVSSPELDALVARLNARIIARPALSDLRAFDAHPNSPFQIGGLYTRRAPYPSFQILSHKLLTSSSTSLLLGSAYYDRFTPAMLSKVGMPREHSAEVKEQ